jgi:hypothetical protein
LADTWTKTDWNGYKEDVTKYIDGIEAALSNLPENIVSKGNQKKV